MSGLPGKQATSFSIETSDPRTPARAGLLRTHHGTIETPAFLPVGTQASVKSLSPDDLREAGAQIILANTYHLYLRPGADLIARLGGLHRFMAWDGPLTTDSGGFQVFSLGDAIEHGVGKIAKMFPGEQPRPDKAPRPKLSKVDEDGVTFRSHVDGSLHRLTPETSIAIQQDLGADIVMAFDECTSPLAGYEYTKQAMERTHRWAERCLAAKTREDQALFGIVQGGEYRDLREQSARFIASSPFPGVAIGGSLGKSKEDMHLVLEWTIPLLPNDRPRHLLGIGEPEDLVACVANGIDLFDCVAPTRMGRHGVLYTTTGRLNIRNAEYREDRHPVAQDCSCYTCRNFTRAYLRHLFIVEELLAYRLATIHNLHFLLGLVRQIREHLLAGTFPTFAAGFIAARQPTGDS